MLVDATLADVTLADATQVNAEIRIGQMTVTLVAMKAVTAVARVHLQVGQSRCSKPSPGRPAISSNATFDS